MRGRRVRGLPCQGAFGAGQPAHRQSGGAGARPCAGPAAGPAASRPRPPRRPPRSPPAPRRRAPRPAPERRAAAARSRPSLGQQALGAQRRTGPRADMCWVTWVRVDSFMGVIANRPPPPPTPGCPAKEGTRGTAARSAGGCRLPAPRPAGGTAQDSLAGRTGGGG